MVDRWKIAAVVGAVVMLGQIVWPAGAAAPPHKPAPAAHAPGGKLLSQQRWQDHSYGVSIRLPVDAQTMRQTADDCLIRIADNRGTYGMTLSVKRSRDRLNLLAVAAAAKQQMIGVQGTTKLLSERDVKVGTHAGRALYFQSPQARGPDILIAEAMVQLDPQTFVVLDVRCDIEQKAAVGPIFDAILDSMRLTDPKELNRQREAALAAGTHWRNTLHQAAPGEKTSRLHQALIPLQLYRLVGKDKDLGYMRVEQSAVTRDLKPGIRIHVESRLAAGGSIYDTLGEYFLADDDLSELWSITTTQRPGGPAGAGGVGGAVPGAQPPSTLNRTFVETGIRTNGTLTLTLDTPEGSTHHKYQVPGPGYLSQVEALMLPQLLPIDHPGTYGFYCYHSRRQAITYRTEQVIPALTGVTIETCLSPNEAPLRTTLDANRRLIEKQLSPEIRLLPTTAAELRKIWPGG